MSNAPKEIWLQWDPDGDAEMYDYPSEGVTWCGEQIHDTDVRYIRADAQPAAPEPTERWEEVRDIIESTMRQWAEHWDEYDTSMDGRYSASAHENLDAVLAWLDAQAEAPEPDWSTAPEDAVAWAVDADGEAHWFVDTPVIYGIRWLSTRHEEMEDDGRYVIPWGIDWRTTLRRRPNA